MKNVTKFISFFMMGMMVFSAQISAATSSSLMMAGSLAPATTTTTVSSLIPKTQAPMMSTTSLAPTRTVSTVSATTTKSSSSTATLAALGGTSGSSSYAAASSTAATSFNTNSQDSSTVMVSNHTKYPDSSTNWVNSVSVDSGDIVSVRIYFHNNGNVDATGTFLKLSVPYGSGQTAGVSGGVGASNASFASGSASISKTASQSFTYAGVARLYKNQTDLKNGTYTSLSAGDVSNLFNGGYNIGTVGTGWSNQGALVVRFKTVDQSGSSTSAPAVTTGSATNITQTSATLNGTFASNGANTATYFAYSTDANKLGGANASSVDKLTAQIGQGVSSGSMAAPVSGLAPNTTYYFRAIAQNKNGIVYGSTGNFKTAGTPNTTTQCNDGIDNDGDGYIDLADPACGGNSNGSTEFPFNGSSTSNAPSASTGSATNITQTNATLNGTFASNGANTATYFAYSTNPNRTGGSGSSAIDFLTPQVSKGISSGSFSAPVSGLTPNTLYYFRAVAQNKNGISYASNVSSFRTNTTGTTTPQCRDGFDNDGDGYTDLSDPACAGNPNGASEFPYNGPVNNPVTQCRDGFDNDGDGLVDLNDPGCMGNPNNNTELPYNFQYSNPQCNDGNDNDGDGFIDINDPACYGNPNGASEFPYNSFVNNPYYTQCRDGIDNDGDGYTDLSDPACGNNPNSPTEYPNNAQQNTVNASTLVATGVTRTSADLNGIIVSAGLGTSEAYFEWGTTVAMNNRTVSQSVPTGEMRVINTISGLTPNTLYYFRMVGRKGTSISYGDIRVFRTSTGGNVTTTPVVNRTTVVSTLTTSGSVSPFIALNIVTDFKTVRVDDTVPYTVTYKNISNQDIDGLVIRVVLQKELQFLKATAGEFLDTENTLTIPVGSLKAGEEQKIVIETKVIKKPKTTNLIVATAIAAFKNPTLGYQEEAIAYELITVSDTRSTNSLGALSLFGSDTFLPNSLLGWLLLALIIFAIVYIGRRMYLASQEKKNTEDEI